MFVYDVIENMAIATSVDARGDSSHRKRRVYLFIYLFNTLFQEGDAISYKLFLLAALIKNNNNNMYNIYKITQSWI